MNQSILSVRVDSNDKKSFDDFCNSVGMNVSTAINLFIKTVIREQKIPFEIKSNAEKDLTNEEIIAKIKEAEEEMERGGKTYTPEEVHKMMETIIYKNV